MTWTPAHDVVREHGRTTGEELDRLLGHVPRTGRVTVAPDEREGPAPPIGGEWSDGPPKRRNESKWGRAIDALAANPGRWARFGPFGSFVSGPRLAAKRRGVPVEVKARTEKGKVYVYVRAIAKEKADG